MNFKKTYNMIGFFMSLYLLILTVISLLKLKLPHIDLLEKIAYGMLAIFVIELIYVFSTYKNKREFFVKEWVSITAVAVSVSLTSIFYFIADWGFVGMAKAAKGLSGMKAGVVGKVAKLGKSTKAIKTAKLYNKVTKKEETI